MNLIDLYFDPSGRINRSTYWLKGVLLLTAIWFAVIFTVALLLGLSGIVNEFGEPEISEDGFVVFLILVALIWIWNGYALSVKRLHDRDKSAWWMLLWALLALIPFVGWILVPIWQLIELGFLEGTPGRNRTVCGRPALKETVPL